MNEYLVGFAAQREGPHAFSAVGRHDDQVIPQRRSSFDNFLVCRTADRQHAFAFDLDCPQLVGQRPSAVGSHSTPSCPRRLTMIE
jgi:hypothetical protein